MSLGNRYPTPMSRRAVFGLGAVAALAARGTPYPVIAGMGSAYSRSDALIDAASLREDLGTEGLVVVGFTPLDEFTAAHIPGSVQVDWPELEVVDTSDDSIAAWRESTGAILGELGITPESTVVAYDNGTLFAARLWWILRYLGHENVHVLNGGLPAWKEFGDEVETGEPATDDSAASAYDGTPNADVLAQMDEVLALLDDENTVIIDARTEREFADGHIPGAVNINYPLNANSEPPLYWKPEDELTALYVDAGVTPDKLVIPYCSTGVRSAVTAFTLHLIGYEDVALYTGSWKEWGEAPNTPKETAGT